MPSWPHVVKLNACGLRKPETALDVFLRASVAAKEDPAILASRLESAEQMLTAHEAKVEEYRAQ